MLVAFTLKVYFSYMSQAIAAQAVIQGPSFFPFSLLYWFFCI